MTHREDLATVAGQEEMHTQETRQPLAEDLFSTLAPRLIALEHPVSAQRSISAIITEFSLTDIPGVGGASTSGAAVGGDADGTSTTIDDSPFPKRALNSNTAGGNAQSGNSASTSAGSVFNVGDNDGEITNTASSQYSRFYMKHIC